MNKKIQKLTVYEWGVFVLAAISVALIVAGLLFPPPGEINGSVLIGVGEIFAFAALFTALHGLSRGADVTAKKGDVEITINNPNDND